MQDIGQENTPNGKKDRTPEVESTTQDTVDQKQASELEGATASEKGEQAAMETENGSPEEIAEDQTAELNRKIAELEATLEDQKNDFLRSRADLENSRRRMEKEKADFIKYGLETFSKELLPVLDSMGKALEVDKDSDTGGMQEGFKLVQKQLLECLERHGVKQIASSGEKFNPDFHQAIARVEDEEVKEETVGQVYQEGYQIHDRLLRPAMVQVLIPNESSSS